MGILQRFSCSVDCKFEDMEFNVSAFLSRNHNARIVVDLYGDTNGVAKEFIISKFKESEVYSEAFDLITNSFRYCTIKPLTNSIEK